MAIEVIPPFKTFKDTDGTPLDAGYIYLGEVGLNAETNQVLAYWDEAQTIVAAQPIRTTGGYTVRNGTPSNVYTDDAYSILIKDKKGQLVYSATGLEGGGTGGGGAGDIGGGGTVGVFDDIRNSTFPDTSLLYVSGNAAVNDGGQGYFYKDLEDTVTPDNNGTLIVDIAGTRWRRQTNGGAVMASWFGVTTGAWNQVGADALVAEAIATTNHMHFPAGVYNNYFLTYSSSPLQKLYITGDGKNNTVFLDATGVAVVGDPRINITLTVPSAVVAGQINQDVEISGIGFRKTGGGNKPTVVGLNHQTPANQNIIEFKDCHIHNVAHALKLDGTIDQALFTDCTIAAITTLVEELNSYNGTYDLSVKGGSLSSHTSTEPFIKVSRGGGEFGSGYARSTNIDDFSVDVTSAVTIIGGEISGGLNNINLRRVINNSPTGAQSVKLLDIKNFSAGFDHTVVMDGCTNDAGKLNGWDVVIDGIELVTITGSTLDDASFIECGQVNTRGCYIDQMSLNGNRRVISQGDVITLFVFPAQADRTNLSLTGSIHPAFTGVLANVDYKGYGNDYSYASNNAAVYYGRVNPDGTPFSLPPGWTSAPLAGIPQVTIVTHNLNTLNYGVVATCQTSNNVDTNASGLTLNSFALTQRVHNSADLTNESAAFILTVYP